MTTSSCPVDVVKIFLCGDLYVCRENSDQDFYSLFSILNLAEVFTTPKANDNQQLPNRCGQDFSLWRPVCRENSDQDFNSFYFTVFHFEFGRSIHYTKS